MIVRRVKRAWVWGFAGLALCLVAPAQAQWNQNQPPPKVVTETAREMQMAPQVEMPGTVIGRNDARIAAEISGRVISVADVGDVVAKGDVIAELDDRLFALQLQENETDIKRLEADLVFLNKQLQRLRSLARTDNAPTRSLEEALANRDKTTQDLARAKIARERTLFQLEKTKVTAPFSGRVVDRLIQVGEYATTGAEIARVVDTESIEVRARIPVDAAPFVRDGMDVTLFVRGELVKAPLRSIIPVGDQVSRTFEIRVALPTDQTWIIGQAVRVGVPSDAPETVVAVPRDALILRASNTYIFKIGEDLKAERVAVKVGVGQGDWVAVSGPIAAGERVVVRGGERLRPGQEVELAGVQSAEEDDTDPQAG